MVATTEVSPEEQRSATTGSGPPVSSMPPDLPVRPAVAPAAGPARPEASHVDVGVDEHAELEPFDDTDRDFGRAIVIGSVLGVLIFSALIGVIVRIQMPDIDTIAVVGIAAWTGLWGGMFLGGTVTVGLWSSRHFH